MFSSLYLGYCDKCVDNVPFETSIDQSIIDYNYRVLWSSLFDLIPASSSFVINVHFEPAISAAKFHFEFPPLFVAESVIKVTNPNLHSALQAAIIKQKTPTRRLTMSFINVPISPPVSSGGESHESGSSQYLIFAIAVSQHHDHTHLYHTCSQRYYSYPQGCWSIYSYCQDC